MNLIPGNGRTCCGMRLGLQKMVKPVTFSIPFPPSVNGLFATVGKRRIKTEAYKAWNTAAGLLLNVQRVPPFTGNVSVDIHLKRPDKRKRDLDNLAKATLDLLVRQTVIQDDSCIVDLRIHWGASDPCLVTISQA